MYLRHIFVFSCIVFHIRLLYACLVYKMPLRHFLNHLDSDEYQSLRFFMFPHQKHVWFIGCVFYTPCHTCVFLMLCSRIEHSNLLHTPLLAMSCLGLYLVFSSSTCHVYFILSSIFKVFFFFFELYFSFILYPSCIFILVHIFISFPHSS